MNNLTTPTKQQQEQLIKQQIEQADGFIAQCKELISKSKEASQCIQAVGEELSGCLDTLKQLTELEGGKKQLTGEDLKPFLDAFTGFAVQYGELLSINLEAVEDQINSGQQQKQQAQQAKAEMREQLTRLQSNIVVPSGIKLPN